MKRMTVITLALALMVTFSITTEADAGWFKKDKKVETNNKAHRFEMFPSMKFFSGTLQRDAYSGWRLDELSLQLMGKSTVTMDGEEEGFLREGQSAIVMGVRYGSTIVAYRVKVMKPDFGYDQPSSEDKMEPGPDPDVGIGTGPM